jgi:hypothetical protein
LNPMAEELCTTAAQPSLIFVSSISQWHVAQKYLLASPCLKSGYYPVVLRWHSRSAAETINAVLDSKPTASWLVFLHQDVFLPEGWAERFCAALTDAEAQLGPLEVVGAYGIRGAGPQAQRAGRVLDRGKLLDEPAPLPCLVDSLDELLFAVRTDTQLRLDTALGFDFYATDLVLQAQMAGLQCAVVDAYCEHWSDTPVAPSISQALAHRVSASGGAFEAKWIQRLPITTPCFTIEQPGDIATAAFSLMLAQPASCGR